MSTASASGASDQKGDQRASQSLKGHATWLLGSVDYAYLIRMRVTVELESERDRKIGNLQRAGMEKVSLDVDVSMITAKWN